MTKLNYELLDSGDARKLERFGPYIIDRPCPQALWKSTLPTDIWDQAHAWFERLSDKEGRWHLHPELPESWTLCEAPLSFKISPTPFGHLGLFPEQKPSWSWLHEKISRAVAGGLKDVKVLNLFAYSGGSTLACAQAGAKVTHVDASKPTVRWAQENAELSQIPRDRIQWLTDDVLKFLAREKRRDNSYSGIILDPPSYGRGPDNSVFKIEDHLPELLDLCAAVLDKKNPLFVLLSCHTNGITPTSLETFLSQHFNPHQKESGEMLLLGSGPPVPSGVWGRATFD